MASALSLRFSTTVLFLMTALFARNGQAIITKESVDSSPVVELELGEQPWLALLEIPDGVYCTGTIVSPTSILSAALCLKSAQNPKHGTAYAGNVRYTELKNFEPPTQNRSIVQYHLYDENNTLTYNLMLVKINPKWTWSGSVQPVGIIEEQRLPEDFTMHCKVSGLGYGSHTEEDSKVARSADMQIGTWDACSDSPQEHRLCALDQDAGAPCVGDLGGSVVCGSEPQVKLYGIISEIADSALEQQPEHCKFPARDAGFQFVGFYAPWIKKTAGDLPSAEEVKAVIKQHEQDFLFSRKDEFGAPKICRPGRRHGSPPPRAGADDVEGEAEIDPAKPPPPGGNEGGASAGNGEGGSGDGAGGADGAEAVVPVAARRWAALLSLLAAGAAGVLA